ncbi:MAG: subclass B3 metallo-beta-lactamase [Polyangia bacterium]
MNWIAALTAALLAAAPAAPAAPAASSPAASPDLPPDPPHRCDDCDAWNRPHAPFRLFGNTYFVGTQGLSAVLITGDAGHVLLDGGLPQSAPLIRENIRKLGFRLQDVKLIATSHGHFDHVGGVAALQRWSGAEVVASRSTAQALQRGENTPDDPQFAFGPRENAFPKVARARLVSDGETVRLGSLTLVAHDTAGHTPGSTTWTWRACEGTTCRSIVYADSLNAVSAPGFRFTDTGPASPSRIEAFRRSIKKVAALPCDLIVSVHPDFTRLDEKLKQRSERAASGAGASADPFLDPQGCRAYAAEAMQRLEARIAEEGKPRPQAAPARP